MATAIILEGMSASAPAGAPAVSGSAWPQVRPLDYDLYRQEARRLRAHAIRDAWFGAGELLRRIMAG